MTLTPVIHVKAASLRLAAYFTHEQLTREGPHPFDQGSLALHSGGLSAPASAGRLREESTLRKHIPRIILLSTLSVSFF